MFPQGSSHTYLPLILAATLIEGLGTGIAGPTTLNLALHGVLPSDTGRPARPPARPASSARRSGPRC